MVKKEKAPKGGETAGEAARKIRLMVPLGEGLQLKPQLWCLVMNYSAQAQY